MCEASTQGSIASNEQYKCSQSRLIKYLLNNSENILLYQILKVIETIQVIQLINSVAFP